MEASDITSLQNQALFRPLHLVGHTSTHCLGIGEVVLHLPTPSASIVSLKSLSIAVVKQNQPGGYIPLINFPLNAQLSDIFTWMSDKLHQHITYRSVYWLMAAAVYINPQDFFYIQLEGLNSTFSSAGLVQTRDNVLLKRTIAYRRQLACAWVWLAVRAVMWKWFCSCLTAG